MAEVKRWLCTKNEMLESMVMHWKAPEGEYVQAADYEKLEAERDAWRTNSERWGRDWRRVVEERDALRAKLARAVHELGITSAQRTSYEVIEEEGGDEYSDYRGAYDIIIEQTRKALAALGADNEV